MLRTATIDLCGLILQDVRACVREILLPAILRLCGDPVAVVRRTAAFAVGRVLAHAGVLAPEHDPLADEAAHDVAQQVCSLALSESFQQRVSYAHAFGSMVQHLSHEDVCTLFVPSFVDVARDLVLDVRLAAVSILLELAESNGCTSPCSEHVADAAVDLKLGSKVVLDDVRVHDLIRTMRADSDGAVARLACACEGRLSNKLPCR